MSKDKVLQARLSEDDYNKVMELSKPYGSVAKWIKFVIQNDGCNTKCNTKQPKDDKIVIQTKDDKRKALANVTVKHSDTCQCFMCKGTF